MYALFIVAAHLVIIIIWVALCLKFEIAETCTFVISLQTTLEYHRYD